MVCADSISTCSDGNDPMLTTHRVYERPGIVGLECDL